MPADDEIQPPSTLTDEEKDNFGAQPETDAGAAGAAGYIANFEGDEINGHRYKLGERIADDVDAGTLAYLVQNGRISPFSADDENPTAALGGAGGTGIPTADETAAKDLVDKNSKAELLKLAEDEGVDVSKDDNKDEIASAIVAARNA